jgi:hypothetical protein
MARAWSQESRPKSRAEEPTEECEGEDYAAASTATQAEERFAAAPGPGLEMADQGLLVSYLSPLPKEAPMYVPSTASSFATCSALIRVGDASVDLATLEDVSPSDPWTEVFDYQKT